MAESSATESLTQRLASGRLTRAGVVDRGALQRTHDRFALPTRASALDRLHRRIEAATPSNGSLPLVRIDRSVAVDSESPLNPITGAPARAAAASATTIESARSFGGEQVARRTPSISRTGEFIARRVADTPGLVAAGSTTSGMLDVKSSRDAVVSQSPVVAGASPSHTLQRMAEANAAHVASSAGVQALAVAPLPRASNAHSAPMIMRSASPSDATATPVHASASRIGRAPSMIASPINGGASESLVVRGGGASSSPRTNTSGPSSSRAAEQTLPRSAASAGELPRVSVATAHAASPVVWRKAISPMPTVTVLAETTSSPTIAVAPTQLVLRKATMSTTASENHVQLPSITTAAPQIVARTTDERHRNAHAGTSTSSYDWNIDWITEQVGRRLARRLEIERERMGARSWR